MNMDCRFNRFKNAKGAQHSYRVPLPFIMILPHTSPQRPDCHASFIAGRKTIIHKENRPIPYI